MALIQETVNERSLGKSKQYIIWKLKNVRHQKTAAWPNGMASDYESEDCGFDPHRGQHLLLLASRPDGGDLFFLYSFLAFPFALLFFCILRNLTHLWHIQQLLPTGIDTPIV